MSGILTFLSRIPWILPFLAAGIMGYLDFEARREQELVPLETRRQELEQEMESTRRDIQSVKEFQERKEQLLKEFDQLQQTFKAAKGAFPATINLPELMERFETFAREIGVNIIQFNPEKDVQRNLLSSSKIKLQIRGTYIRGMQYLSQLARMERVVNIESVRFGAPREDGTGAGYLLDIDITMLTYFVGDT